MDYRLWTKKIWIALLVLCLLTPIGIYLPQIFNAGAAWGEWDTETVQKKIGYVPEGMNKDAQLYRAPIPDYSLQNQPPTVWAEYGNYIVSGIIGIGIIFILTWLLMLYYRKHG